MNYQQVMSQALAALHYSKRSHYYCEDPWYSCPSHPEGCANPLEGDSCNCGADEVNIVLDRAITALQAALLQLEQCKRHNPCERLPDGYCARCHSEMYP